MGLRLNPSAVITRTDVGVLVRSDLGTFRLDGDDVHVFLNEIVPLLDGTRDESALEEALADYPADSVRALVDVLVSRGLVDRVDPERARWHGQDAFLNALSTEATPLASAHIAVVGLEAWAAVATLELAAAGVGEILLLDDHLVAVEDLLHVRGFREDDVGTQRGRALAAAISRQAPWSAVSVLPLESFEAEVKQELDLVIAGIPADDRIVNERVARVAQAQRLRSLHGEVDGFDAVLGPAVDPGETACWKCARLRILANSDHPDEAIALERAASSERPPSRGRTYLAPAPALLGHLAAIEAIKLVTGYAPSRLYGRQLVQNLISLETTLHTVIRVPWCPICGGPSADRKSDDLDAEDDQPRLLSSLNEDELFASLEGLVDSRTGIVRHLAVVTPDVRDPDFPVTATAVLSRTGFHPGSEPEIASGKGATRVEALIGACGEGIERYSAAQYRRSHLRRAAFAELGAAAVDPSALALYEDWQYEQPGFPFDRYSEDIALDWVEGRWFDGVDPVLVPALPTFFNYRAPDGEYFCQVSSSGLAAGARQEDAEARAVYELLERDAFMLTWHARLPARRIIVDAPLEVSVTESIRQLERAGVELALYLLPIDIVPVVLCVGYGDGNSWPGATVALAAASNVRSAVRKAILEHGHIGPYIRRLARDEGRVVPAEPEDVKTLLDHALYYSDPVRRDSFAFLERGGEANLSELSEVALSRNDVIARVRSAGLRLVVVDLTSPDLRLTPFSVARALGAYIQPIDFGFAARRLGNPRLKALLQGDANRDPHPVA